MNKKFGGEFFYFPPFHSYLSEMKNEKNKYYNSSRNRVVLLAFMHADFSRL